MSAPDAVVRIGELSAGLEKAPNGPGRGKKSLPTDGKPFKAAVLKSAGISTSAANRAEPPELPLHTVMLSAHDAAAVERAIGCLERALERCQEALQGASVYGEHVLGCATDSTLVALDALRSIQ